MWPDVGKADGESSSAVNIWVLLDGSHRVEHVTFVICDENVKRVLLKLVLRTF